MIVFAIVRPRPARDRLLRRVGAAEGARSKSRFCSSAGIPTPVSATSTTASRPVCETRTETLSARRRCELEGVARWVVQGPARGATGLRASRGAVRQGGWPARPACRRRRASPASMSLASTSFRSTSSRSSASLPASTCAMKSRSPTSCVRRFVLRSATERNRCCSGAGASPPHRPARAPGTRGWTSAGVRSSCDTERDELVLQPVELPEPLVLLGEGLLRALGVGQAMRSSRASPRAAPGVA